RDGRAGRRAASSRDRDLPIGVTGSAPSKGGGRRPPTAWRWALLQGRCAHAGEAASYGLIMDRFRSMPAPPRSPMRSARRPMIRRIVRACRMAAAILAWVVPVASTAQTAPVEEGPAAYLDAETRARDMTHAVYLQGGVAKDADM